MNKAVAYATSLFIATFGVLVAGISSSSPAIWTVWPLFSLLSG
jgi:hypothetical protein